MKEVTDELGDAGVKLFAEPFDKLLNAVDAKCKLPSAPVNQDDATRCRRSERRGGRRASKIGASPAKCAGCGRATRRCGPATDEGKWLGWLGITEEQLAHASASTRSPQDVKAGGIHARAAARHGRIEPVPGSAARSPSARSTGFPELHVLDSTDPAQIRAIEEKIDLARTLFIVSSKSGSTLEPKSSSNISSSARAATAAASSRSPIRARRCSRWPSSDGFRHIFFGVPSIGGRYSALSDFGMIPAAVHGHRRSPCFWTGAEAWRRRARRACRWRRIRAWCWARCWERSR